MTAPLSLSTVAAAVAGDRAAVDALACSARDVAYGVARARGASLADADDAAQAVAVRVLERAASLRDPARWTGWIETMAVRSVADLHRRAPKPIGGAAELERAEPVAVDGAESGADPGPAVRDLPEGMRRAVVLHYFRGLTVAETAAALSVSPATLRRALSRARARLAGSVARGKAVTA